MLTRLLYVLALLGIALGAPFVPCPDLCRCEIQDKQYEKIGVDCTSLDFLGRLQPKQISAIVAVNVTGIGLPRIDPKLKLLKNVESLDLSNNNIVSITSFPQLPKLKYLNLSSNHLKDVKGLPKGLEILDVSSNSIHDLDNSFEKLLNLKKINLNKNPLECNCDGIIYHRKLLENNVKFETPVRCASPKTFKGKDMKYINCSMIADDLLKHMMSDQPSFEDANVFESDDNDNDFSDEREYIDAQDTDKIVHEEPKTNSDIEGSGDDGSGDGEIIVPHAGKEEVPVACHINCSTPPPLGKNDEVNASEPIGILESSKILFEDIIGKADSEEKPKPVEEPIQKVRITAIDRTPIKEEPEIVSDTDKSDVEAVATSDVVPGEMERAMIGGTPEDSNMTYYILGGIFVVFVALIIVVAMRKRGRRHKRRKAPVKENGHYEEMKPLKTNGKAGPPDEKPAAKVPENAPLIIEGNGKLADNDSLKDHVDNERQRAVSTPDATENGHVPDEDQGSPKSDTLKVTIKASEIPDSIPRTPLFVHRQLTDDGNYTTTLQPTP